MCLITNQSKPLIAKEDITVYKALDEINEIDALVNKLVTYYVTPYRYYPMEFNKLYINKQEEDVFRLPFYTSVGKGFYHAYSNLESIPTSVLWNHNIYKAIIPKGSIYYMNSNAIASKQIIILKEKVNVPFN